VSDASEIGNAAHSLTLAGEKPEHEQSDPVQKWSPQ
jgi:hypothetical protein